MIQKIRFKIQVRNIEHSLLLSSETLETDCSKNCQIIEQSILSLKEQVRKQFTNHDIVYFQAVFLNHPNKEQLAYFNEHEL